MTQAVGAGAHARPGLPADGVMLVGVKETRSDDLEYRFGAGAVDDERGLSADAAKVSLPAAVTLLVPGGVHQGRLGKRAGADESCRSEDSTNEHSASLSLNRLDEVSLYVLCNNIHMIASLLMMGMCQRLPFPSIYRIVCPLRHHGVFFSPGVFRATLLAVFG